MTAPTTDQIVSTYAITDVAQLNDGDAVALRVVYRDAEHVEDATVVGTDTGAGTVRLLVERTGITKEYAVPDASSPFPCAFTSTLPHSTTLANIVVPDEGGVVRAWARNERRKQREESLRGRIKELAEMVAERGANDDTIIAELGDSVTALQSLKSRIAAYKATGRD